jgi:hypothetical protein
VGQVVDPIADLVGQGEAFKTELPHLSGGGADQTELQGAVQTVHNLSPCNPDMNTLHYNNRNTPKHAQGWQNPAAPIPLSPPTHPFFCSVFLVPPLPITQISISSLITITPSQLPLLIDIITKGFSI